MGIVVKKFGFDEIRRKLASQNKASEGTPDNPQVRRLLAYIGEELCNHARTITPSHDSGGYEDQTGNLRSSIGYRIYRDAEIVQDGGFKNVSGGDGIDQAKNALDNYGLAYSIPTNGWTLVIVAGMSYAAYVEAKGYNVLHLTNIEMKKKIEELKKDLGMS